MDYYNNQAHQDAITEAEDELIEALKKYSDAFVEASTQNKGIPTINQIENLWCKLDCETRSIFVKLVSGTINACDESEMISSKKANT